MSATLERPPNALAGASAPVTPEIGAMEQGPPKRLLDMDIVQQFAKWMVSPNIAEDLDDATRGRIADQAKREYALDDETRAAWKTKYKQWLDFAMQIVQEKSFPWPHAANVIYPLITTAAIQFSARAYPAIIQGKNVVKGTVIGSDAGIPAPGVQQGSMAPGQPGMAQPPQGPGMPPQGVPMPGMGRWLVPPGAKQERADKIGRHMSWQLLSEMPEWEVQTDRLLLVLAITGTMFRKSYFDSADLRNVSETVDALRLVVNYKAKSFEVAPRISEEIDFYPWEIETKVRAGLWLDHGTAGYGTNNDGNQDEQAPVTFIEQHRRYDLDGDGYDEPVIVTFARDSGKLARITLGFDEDCIEASEDGRVQKITPITYYTKYGFIPSPDGGVYDIGLGSLLYPLNAAINTTINQMFDAGTLAVTGGGFIGGGMSMNTGSVRFAVGEYKVVNTPGATLRENLVSIPFPGPNSVLFQLLQFLVEAAREVASIKDVLSGEIPGGNTPGILGLAVIQQGLKVFSAIYKRVHRSLRQEYEKLFRLNRLYLPEEAGYRVGAEYFEIKRSDYEEGAGVEPVSDPEVVTDMQKMGQANFLLQFKDDPWFNAREVRLRALQAGAIDQTDKLLVSEPPKNPEIIAGMAQLDIENRMVQLRSKELDIRAAHEEADADIKRGKDKATEIKELSQAILNLANAKKADAEADQNWYVIQLEQLRQQIEFLNTASESNPPENSPALAAAGGGGGAAGGVGGPPAGGISGMAPPPGLAGGAGLSDGLPGQSGA